jgi:hypothetical protein
LVHSPLQVVGMVLGHSATAPLSAEPSGGDGSVAASLPLSAPVSTGPSLFAAASVSNAPLIAASLPVEPLMAPLLASAFGSLSPLASPSKECS